MKPINIELFCCSGGMSKGFKDAGIQFDIVVDSDIDACNSYEANMGKRPIQMDVNDFLRLVKSGMKQDINLLVADPPCTP